MVADESFGRVNAVLYTAPDGGASYYDANTIIAALGYDGAGMMGTTFCKFTPNRSRHLYWRTISDTSLDGVLRTELCNDGCLCAFKHIDYGDGYQFSLTDFAFFADPPPTQGGRAEFGRRRIDSTEFNFSPFGSMIMSFVIPAAVLAACLAHKVRIVTNMGVANPLGAAHRVHQLARELGLDAPKVAAVSGDDLLGVMGPDEIRALPTIEGLDMGDAGIVAANAYIGARPVADALALQEAGCFALVIEGVPDAVGTMVTEAVDVPTIGIGAGPTTDGQVLVYHDLSGLENRFKPKFVRRYGTAFDDQVEALRRYASDVRASEFPGPDETYKASDGFTEALGLYGSGPTGQ